MTPGHAAPPEYSRQPQFTEPSQTTPRENVKEWSDLLKRKKGGHEAPQAILETVPLGLECSQSLSEKVTPKQSGFTLPAGKLKIGHGLPLVLPLTPNSYYILPQLMVRLQVVVSLLRALGSTNEVSSRIPRSKRNFLKSSMISNPL